jgi:hypothetical protein
MLAVRAMLGWAGIGGHQRLPDLVRLAIAGDDMPMAQTAAWACEAEAAAETRPARAAAASLRCRGLLEADPAPSGREALTLTEVKIAALVAGGDSASDIARGMFFPRSFPADGADLHLLHPHQARRDGPGGGRR